MANSTTTLSLAVRKPSNKQESFTETLNKLTITTDNKMSSATGDMQKMISHPSPAVGAIIIKDGQILLIKRGSDPSYGKWSVPGGHIELGETMEAALKREVMEEVGIDVKINRLAGVYDLIVQDGENITYHYVLIEFFADTVSGNIKAGSDALECRWVPLTKIDEFDLTPTVIECLRENNLMQSS